MLGAAQQGVRRDVARELVHAVLHRGEYRGSREELTPGRGDPLAPLPVTVIALATLIRPGCVAALRRGQCRRVLAHPGRVAADPPGRGRRPGCGRAPAAVRREGGQPPLTCWTEEIVPCAVCSAELTDEVPVIEAWIAVQMACDTFG